jgi:hypothetical protein
LTAAKHFASAQGLAGDPPRGVGGLHALSKLIARARQHDADGNDSRYNVAHAADEDEREFVAGAGAYLGLLLLDHLPHGAHVANSGEHRLRLGRHGFFDPFAAVEAALSARDTPRALIESVKCAEAEAAGCGPIARVVSALSAALAREPGVRILDHFEKHIWLEVQGMRVEFDLTNVIAATTGASDAFLGHAVERVCASLLEQAAPVFAWDAARELVMPRLVGQAFLNSVPDPDDLYLRKLSSDVWETMVLRFGERARYVRRVEVESWTMRGAAPRRYALANLARSSKDARFLEHMTKYGSLVVANSGDNLDAARLLLPSLHDVLASALGSPFLAATPHRDTLLACSCGPRGLVDELLERVNAAVSGTPHAISRRLWLVTGAARIQPFTDD